MVVDVACVVADVAAVAAGATVAVVADVAVVTTIVDAMLRVMLVMLLTSHSIPLPSGVRQPEQLKTCGNHTIIEVTSIL